MFNPGVDDLYADTWLILILSTTSNFIPFLKQLETLSQTT